MGGHATDWQTLTTNYANYLRFERKLARNTVESYLHDVARLREFVECEYGLLPAEVGSEHIEAFMSEVYDSGAVATTQARLLSGLKSFFTFLQIAGVSESSPVEFVDMPKTGRKLPDVLSVEEIDAILATIDLSTEQGHRNKAMLETLYSCGLRVSELTTLRLGDLFFDEGFIRVTGKGDKQRLVPVSEDAQRNISLWLEQRRTMHIEARDSDVVFLNRRGRHLSRMTVFNVIKAAATAAGITKQVSPHTFRHSFATHLLEGGASIRQVQEMLGHESILTTEIYTHLDRTHLRRSVEKHHPLA